MALLVLNVPRYFAEPEVRDFEDYLHAEAQNYYLVTRQGQIIGAGGYNLLENQTEGRISWDFFHPDFQGRGWGTQLLRYRLDRIKAIPTVTRIVVRTSQWAYHFYEKNGFELCEVIPDYWAEGYDLYRMEYPLILRNA